MTRHPDGLCNSDTVGNPPDSADKKTSYRIKISKQPQNYAAMGIRTPVEGVRVPHDWPVYTIAARYINVL